MEKSNRLIPLIYGYAVCLTSIIVLFISLSMIIGSMLALQDPLRDTATRFGFGPSASLSSYEAYKIDILTGRTSFGDSDDSKDKYTPSDQELKAAYESQKEDHIAGVRHEATKNMSNGFALLIVAVLLFALHWKWLSGMSKASAA